MTPNDSPLAHRLEQTVSDIVLGQTSVVQQMVLLMMAGGHGLLEGPPGSGKTLAARTMASALDCSFRRVQFTPDLMPSDLIGTEIWNAGTSSFELREGPVFCDVLLADEINRTPPKTQAALLEAMEERQVSIGKESLSLGASFTVLATQNPLEFEGTYPLPEAQLDRFMMRIVLPGIDPEDEKRVYKRFSGSQAHQEAAGIAAVLSKPDLLGLRKQVESMAVDDTIVDYVQALAGATRDHGDVLLGASVRAGLHVLAVAKAAAVFAGRAYVTPDDVHAHAVAVLAHRLLVHPDALVDGVRPADVVEQILKITPVPR